MAKILYGKIIRDEICDRLAEEFASATIPPVLAVVQVGENEASTAFIKQKVKFGESVGASVAHTKLPESATVDDVAGAIDVLNEDGTVHGIILQLPLPAHLVPDILIDRIRPEKDVDGLTALNVKKLWTESGGGLMPATAKGILTMLDYCGIPIRGKGVTVVGRSALVGKSIAHALLNRDATVTICHKETVDLAKETRAADIVIVAVGAPGLITKDYVKEGQVIIDVGITAIEMDGARKLVGDVLFEEVEPIIAAISPVPGGVGPLTVASLFENLHQSWKRSI